MDGYRRRVGWWRGRKVARGDFRAGAWVGGRSVVVVVGVRCVVNCGSGVGGGVSVVVRCRWRWVVSGAVSCCARFSPDKKIARVEFRTGAWFGGRCVVKVVRVRWVAECGIGVGGGVVVLRMCR